MITDKKPRTPQKAAFDYGLRKGIAWRRSLSQRFKPMALSKTSNPDALALAAVEGSHPGSPEVPA